jgi:hypothetical protein
MSSRAKLSLWEGSKDRSEQKALSEGLVVQGSLLRWFAESCLVTAAWLSPAVYGSVRRKYLATDVYRTGLSYLYIDFSISYVIV